MGKNNIKMGWIPTRDMAFSSKGKAARFRQIQGRSPLFLDQLRPERWKKNFFKTTPPPSEGLDLPVVCMERCTYPFLVRASILNFHYSVKYNGNIMVVWQTVSCLSFLLGTAAIIIIWYRIYNLNSYQLCWRQRFFAKKLLMS